MSDLEIRRKHSGSHIMTAAVEMMYKVGLGVGPWTDEGFYQDFDFGGQEISEKNFKEIEKKMRWIVNKNFPIQKAVVDAAQAKEICKDDPYKMELVEGIIERGEEISFYYIGESLDTAISVNLCAGPHLSSTGELGAFKLLKIAGAYWRGDERKEMLTRIYGVAFSTKEELEAHLHMLEEAKKRDHRKLGKELDLFTFSELVGPGLPLWTPQGTLMRFLLDEYVWELRKAKGYDRVEIPHITKKELYETSGHWQKFSEELFKVTTREGHEFAMKPMNCPHHTQIYARQKWSYRELPQRYANTTTCYRDEQTGELHGLSRVRAFSQDDAHVFCRESQVKEEFLKIWDIIDTFYGSVGFGKLQVRLSLHDPDNFDAYLGTKELWEGAENAIRDIAKSRGIDFVEEKGEAAFYGPKVDFVTKDSIGREWQVATIQLDINMPERFDLSCTNEQGDDERIVMIHAAIMGSIERFFSIMIEHHAGAFPTWLAPVQVAILPVSTEKHLSGAEEMADRLRAAGIRVEVDSADETVGKKIRAAAKLKVPYVLVVGDKELSGEDLMVRVYGQEEQISLAESAFIERVVTETVNRIA